MIGLNRADSILTTIWNILQESGDFTWRVSDCEELVGFFVTALDGNISMKISVSITVLTAFECN